NWTANVKVGGTSFNQIVKIETIKPNRLKINLDLGGDKIISPDITGNLDVSWLHGTPGKNLKAEFEVTLATTRTTFAKFNDYSFQEPGKEFIGETEPVFQGTTDDQGKATFKASLPASSDMPGFMTAIFRGKVFEASGNFSIDRISLPYFPFESYAGVRVLPSEKNSGMLYTDTTH